MLMQTIFPTVKILDARVTPIIISKSDKAVWNFPGV